MKSTRLGVSGTIVDTGELVLDSEKPTASRLDNRTEEALRSIDVKFRVKMRK